MHGIISKVLLLVLVGVSSIWAGNAEVKELQKLQAKQADGVIPFTTQLLYKATRDRQRTYTIVLFFTSQHVYDKPQLFLPRIRKEFGILAKSYLAQEKESQEIFFGTVELTQERELIQKFSLDILPYIVCLDETFNPDRATPMISSRAQLSPRDNQDLPWSASTIAMFVKQYTHVELDLAVENNFVRSRLFKVCVVVVMMVLVPSMYYLTQSPIIRNQPLQCIASLFVVWFATSGGLHDIIRGMPLIAAHQDGRVKMFMEGQGQLGLEGFIMGSLVMSTGLSVATLAALSPRVKNPQFRTLISYTALFVGVLSVYQVFSIYNWKMGYRPRLYLF